MKFARRAALASFVFGLIATGVLMMYTAPQVRELSGAGTVRTELLTLTFFTSERTVGDGGSSVTLNPGFGVFVLLGLLPALCAFLAWQRKDKRHTKAQSSSRQQPA